MREEKNRKYLTRLHFFLRSEKNTRRQSYKIRLLEKYDELSVLQALVYNMYCHNVAAITM